MIKKILSFFGFENLAWNARGDVRRRYIRHPGFHAEVMVGNRIYSIRNWSMGGIAFETAPDARIQAGDGIQAILKFRFPHDTITIQQQVRIVRTEKRTAAAEFTVLPPPARRQLERVLDGLHAQSFLKSQIA